MRMAVLNLACLGALAVMPAYAQQGDAQDAQALRREIAAMRRALEGMQQRLDRLEQRDHAPVQAQPQAQAKPERYLSPHSGHDGVIHPTRCRVSPSPYCHNAIRSPIHPRRHRVRTVPRARPIPI